MYMYLLFCERPLGFNPHGMREGVMLVCALLALIRHLVEEFCKYFHVLSVHTLVDMVIYIVIYGHIYSRYIVHFYIKILGSELQSTRQYHDNELWL